MIQSNQPRRFILICDYGSPKRILVYVIGCKIDQDHLHVTKFFEREFKLQYNIWTFRKNLNFAHYTKFMLQNLIQHTSLGSNLVQIYCKNLASRAGSLSLSIASYTLPFISIRQRCIRFRQLCIPILWRVVLLELVFGNNSTDSVNFLLLDREWKRLQHIKKWKESIKLLVGIKSLL